MASTSPRSLSAAGNALIAAGFVAAAVGGLYGLARFAPGMVVLSVLLVIGYSVAGYLLLSRREPAFRPAAGLAAVLVLATLWVFRPDVARFLDPQFAYFLAFPALAYLLAYAAAHLAGYALARRNTRVLWPPRGTEAVLPLLLASAAAPVLSAFLLLHDLRATGADDASAVLIVGGALLAAATTMLGGVASSVRRHPKFTLVGAAAGFGASVIFLFQFAGRGRTGVAFDYGGVPEIPYVGQVYALAGMLLAGFPLAMSVVAWVELEAAKREHANATGRSPPPKIDPPGARPQPPP